MLRRLALRPAHTALRAARRLVYRSSLGQLSLSRVGFRGQGFGVSVLGFRVSGILTLGPSQSITRTSCGLFEGPGLPRASEPSLWTILNLGDPSSR